MSEATDVVAPEQVVGTTDGETVPEQSQAEEQAVKPEEQQTTQTEQDDTTPITLAQAKQMAKEAEENAFRRAQSYADQGRVKLQQKMQEVEAAIQTAEKYGKPYSDEEKAMLRQNAQVAALKDEPDDATAQLTPAQVEEAQYVARELGAYDQTLQEEYGFNVDANDPEVKNLRITGEPVKDMKSVKAMFQAKKDRLASAPQSNTTEANADNKAAVRAAPGVQGQKPTPIASSSKDYWNEVEKERSKHV